MTGEPAPLENITRAVDASPSLPSAVAERVRWRMATHHEELRMSPFRRDVPRVRWLYRVVSLLAGWCAGRCPLASVLVVCTIASYASAEPAPKLAPDSMFTVAFPDLPPTFYAVFEKKDVKAQMTVFLPSNYDLARKLPLLIFLNGWDGGVGDNPGMARSLCKGKDFICVNMPLFKAGDFRVDKPNVPGAGFVMCAEDGKYMWPHFKLMLEKLDALVPNVDPAHRILGGFSNGAHATAALLDGSDGEVARRFSAFFFVEGGGRLQHYDLLKSKPFLMVSSNAKSKSRAQEICDTAKAAGAKATLLVEDVGKHDFPVSAYSAVGQWLHGVVRE